MMHGDRIADLKNYTREVMRRVAEDLGQPELPWIGTCHFDTDQPHAHVLVRGKRASGKDLVIPRDYIGYGFRARAQEVARLAPTAGLLRVALASNRAFALIAGFFAHFESRIPAQVSALDHLDFEAKLQATAGDRTALRSAAAELERTWAALRPGVVDVGGARVARRFDAHVARLLALSAAGGRPAAREAQRGLDLVDEIEAVYQR